MTEPVPDTLSKQLRARTAALVPGQVLGGRYRVGERIGGGGMADVFRGRDEWLCVDVAIKVLKPQRVSEDMCARLLQEGRAAAVIDHPHLLRVYNVGVEAGVLYLVMELLHGHTLAELLRMVPGGRLAWRRVLELMLPALDAIDRAHRLGFVHRDLKPDNLFVRRREGREELVVLDLGIVRTVAPERKGRGSPATTEVGQILGTPAYMAPEQANGDTVDLRADVYAVGVTLFRAVSGEFPFVDHTAEPGIAQMARHLFATPRSLADLDPSLPPALVDAVAQALAKSPADRQPSVRALADELRACVLDHPAGAPATMTFARSSRQQRVHRMSLAGVFLVVLLGAQVSAGQGDPAPSSTVAPALKHAAARVTTDLSESAGAPRATDPRFDPAAVGPAAATSGPPGPAPRDADAAASNPTGPAARAAAGGLSEGTGAPAGARPPAEPRGGSDAPSPAPDLSFGTDPARAPAVDDLSRGTSPPDAPPGRASPARDRHDDAAPRDADAVARTFAGAAAAISGCQQRYGDLDEPTLEVEVRVDVRGHVLAAGPRDRDRTLLAPCVRRALAALRFGPGPAGALGHAYTRAVGGPP
jgi:serine/threonine-protein kinase